MKRRDLIKGLSASALSLVSPGRLDAKQRSDARPNILFIMSDDHAVNAIGCYGGRLAKIAPTPNIDRLAGEGMRLERCFCANSICVPSRASILTGQYSHKNGVYTLGDALDPGRQTVAKLLQASGYQTAMIGKWHLRSDPQGFDYWNILPGQGKYFDPNLKSMDGEIKKYQGYSTDIITDLSIDWMDRRERDKPFFLMCHFKAPHEPWEYAKRYTDYLSGDDIPEPDTLWEDKSHRSEGSREYGFTIDDMATRQQRENYHSEGTVDFDSLDKKETRKKAYQIFLKRYLRTVKGVDENIGKLLNYLDENGLSENTVVIYTSDQGYFLGEHNYIDKRWMYDEALQMPFVVRYPKEIEPGRINDDIALNVDFAPTFLDYAGRPVPDRMQGRSLRNLFKSRTPNDWRESMYYRYWMHTNRPAHYGIRTKDFKLIFFYGLPLGMSGAKKKHTKPGWELYDLRNDPCETKNVYNDPAYRETVQSLKKELFRLKKELGDSDAPYPDLMKLREEFSD